MDKEYSLLIKIPVQQVDSTCRLEMEAENNVYCRVIPQRPCDFK
jgi:hypothetical protein